MNSAIRLANSDLFNFVVYYVRNLFFGLEQWYGPILTGHRMRQCRPSVSCVIFCDSLSTLSSSRSAASTSAGAPAHDCQRIFNVSVLGGKRRFFFEQLPSRSERPPQPTATATFVWKTLLRRCGKPRAQREGFC